MSQYTIHAICFSNGLRVPAPYFKVFDHEADGGSGYAEFTSDIAEALRFETAAEAFEFWKRQSKTRPLRDDGQPNRPMTCTSVTVEPVP